jgi:hypothetical protein
MLFSGLFLMERPWKYLRFELVAEVETAQLRSSGKNHGVQVMDTAEGGIHAWYDLKILQSTGFLYDFYFYEFPENPFVQRLRERFLREMSAAPPDLIVIALSSWPDGGLGVARIDRWPELRNFIQFNYSQETQSDGYRIYVRNQ